MRCEKIVGRIEALSLTKAVESMSVAVVVDRNVNAFRFAGELCKLLNKLNKLFDYGMDMRGE